MSRPEGPPGADADDEPVLPVVTRDEHGAGWGERPDTDALDDDWYLRERPPHHEG